LAGGPGFVIAGSPVVTGTARPSAALITKMSLPGPPRLPV
jgi:hypothetical protein